MSDSARSGSAGNAKSSSIVSASRAIVCASGSSSAHFGFFIASRRRLSVALRLIGLTQAVPGQGQERQVLGQWPVVDRRVERLGLYQRGDGLVVLPNAVLGRARVLR